MKLSKDYCQVLHQERKNPFQIYELGSSSAGKALVGSELNISLMRLHLKYRVQVGVSSLEGHQGGCQGGTAL